MGRISAKWKVIRAQDLFPSTRLPSEGKVSICVCRVKFVVSCNVLQAMEIAARTLAELISNLIPNNGQVYVKSSWVINELQRM